MEKLNARRKVFCNGIRMSVCVSKPFFHLCFVLAGQPVWQKIRKIFHHVRCFLLPDGFVPGNRRRGNFLRRQLVACTLWMKAKKNNHPVLLYGESPKNVFRLSFSPLNGTHKRERGMKHEDKTGKQQLSTIMTGDDSCKTATA